MTSATIGLASELWRSLSTNLYKIARIDLICFFSPGMENSTSSSGHVTVVDFGATVWMTIAYVVIFIFGFFGNACIIYIVATRKRMKSTFNFLIVNMAIGDLLVSIFIMPFAVSKMHFLVNIIVNSSSLKRFHILKNISIFTGFLEQL